MAGEKILIVEDEDNIALALTHLLGLAGYELTHVNRGDQALPAIKSLRPDLVLLDVMLPGMSGYEICQAVRAEPDYAGMKILIMTARGTEIERRKGLALGADGFVTKPFNLADFKDEVARQLSGGAT